jgi:hypothetical protein
MTTDTRINQTTQNVRNPFGTMDVPDPNGPESTAFAATASLDGSRADTNAVSWGSPSHPIGLIEGYWSSRWNGGADPTIAGDAPEKWKQGQGELRLQDDRAYLLFDWDGGKRKGLIDARRDGATRLVGRYINLTNPDIVRPWIGLIVSERRIDGRWSGGRLDFRR